MQKPDGLVLIERHDLPHILHGLALRDLTGIGPNMEARLLRAGITTVQRLCAATKPELRRVWGSVEGEVMFERLRGAPVPLAAEAPPSTLGHSHVLPPAKRNTADARSILHRMLQKAAMRLRRQDLVASRMQISVRFAVPKGWEHGGRDHWGVEACFSHTDDTLLLTHHLDALWAHYPDADPKRVPMHVGVVFSGLIGSRHRTQSLFETEQPHTALMQAVDRLNLRFGKSTIYFGAAHLGRDHAPMRIAFTRIPDPAVE
jgi:DNA polymerase-4